MPDFYEFFAGGGMVRQGLGSGWACRFANDFDAKKARAYADNWGGEALRVGDIRALAANDLPGAADLMWGSFPCQDLSLAGVGAGLKGERSGTFHAFWGLARGLIEQGRGPGIVALENVCGALTSHGGRDFRSICSAFAKVGYRFGALVIDAALFVPQSRPRLFIIGVRPDIAIDPGLIATTPPALFHSPRLRQAMEALDADTAGAALWWDVPPPPRRNIVLADLIEDHPADIAWRSAADTQRLLALMCPLNRAKVAAAQRAGRPMVGTVYRRTRIDDQGRKVQRAEVRFDDIAGCLRTPSGGSSRQTILLVDGDKIGARLMSARETARLMGLPDDYRLPRGYSEAYHLTGDGVVVPVVRHLAEHLFEPLLGLGAGRRRAAA